VAGVGAGGAMAVPPPPDGSFSGQTAQENARDRRVHLSTDANGQISQFAIEWRAKCKRKGRFWSAGTAVRGRAIELQGETFSADGSYEGRVNRKVTGTVTATMRGSFTDDDHAVGTWEAKVVVRKNGRKIDKCKADTTWAVERDQ
jgi:hypothetical protein